MKYEVKFTGSNAAKEAQALEECRFWLGKAFDRAVAAIRNEISAPHLTPRQKIRTVNFLCCMLGISGRFPVRAMLREALK